MKNTNFHGKFINEGNYIAKQPHFDYSYHQSVTVCPYGLVKFIRATIA